MDPEPDERYVGGQGGPACVCVCARAGMIGMSTPACLQVFHLFALV